MSDKHNNLPARSLTRRDFLKVGGLAGAASFLAACGVRMSEATQIPAQVIPTPTLAPSPSAQQPSQEIAVRIAHITDMHIGPDGPGVEGFTKALHAVEARHPDIDLIINTGDSIGDALGATKGWVQAQWDAFTGVVKAECSLPIRHAIGNHDVWGWGLPAEEQNSLSTDPLFGKGWAVQELGISNRYYSFDLGGWRFLVLDSTHLPEFAIGQVYTSKLDEEQFNWLVQQLEATPQSTPVCVASHAPILSACELLDGNNEVSGNWVVPGAFVHIDARRLWSLFWQHPNVKLCLSGHTHQVEDLRYHGVKYLTDGAVCGNWWNGSYMDFPPGYVVVNLYKDGSSASEFFAY
ncbi:MAG: metallophosphoesterase [Anaerolineales bacterium]